MRLPSSSNIVFDQIFRKSECYILNINVALVAKRIKACNELIIKHHAK